MSLTFFDGFMWGIVLTLMIWFIYLHLPLKLRIKLEEFKEKK